mgnify:CR=1 FL=1
MKIVISNLFRMFFEILPNRFWLCALCFCFFLPAVLFLNLSKAHAIGFYGPPSCYYEGSFLKMNAASCSKKNKRTFCDVWLERSKPLYCPKSAGVQVKKRFKVRLPLKQIRSLQKNKRRFWLRTYSSRQALPSTVFKVYCSFLGKVTASSGWNKKKKEYKVSFRLITSSQAMRYQRACKLLLSQTSGIFHTWKSNLLFTPGGYYIFKVYPYFDDKAGRPALRSHSLTWSKGKKLTSKEVQSYLKKARNQHKTK